MRGFLDFLKTTIAGGFFVVLPVVLISLLLIELYDAAVMLATPVAALLPADTLDETGAPKLFAILMLVVACFFTGLVMRTAVGTRLGFWVEGKILRPIPGYAAIKSFSQTMVGTDSGGGFDAVFLETAERTQSPAFLIEEIGEDKAAVYVPLTPTPGVGMVHVVDRDRIQKVTAPTGNFMEALYHFGVGTSRVFPDGGTSTRDER